MPQQSPPSPRSTSLMGVAPTAPMHLRYRHLQGYRNTGGLVLRLGRTAPDNEGTGFHPHNGQPGVGSRQAQPIRASLRMGLETVFFVMEIIGRFRTNILPITERGQTRTFFKLQLQVAMAER